MYKFLSITFPVWERHAQEFGYGISDTNPYTANIRSFLTPSANP